MAACTAIRDELDKESKGQKMKTLFGPVVELELQLLGEKLEVSSKKAVLFFVLLYEGIGGILWRDMRLVIGRVVRGS